MIRTLSLVSAGLVALVLAACSTPSYINIPPQDGDLARGNPNADDVRDLMVASIRSSVELERLGGAFEVVLPGGSNQQTYEHVVLAVGGGAITPDTLRTQPVPTVRVASIRVRGNDAEVDVVRPSPTGRGAVTVYLKWYVGVGWKVERVRPWRVNPDNLLPPPPADVPVATPPGMSTPSPAPDDAAAPAASE